MTLAPLGKLADDPDLLIFAAREEQSEVILRAMSYSTGKMWTSKSTGVIGCAWLFVYPYLTGELNYTPILSMGMRALKVFTPGTHLLSIPFDMCTRGARQPETDAHHADGPRSRQRRIPREAADADGPGSDTLTRVGCRSAAGDLNTQTGDIMSEKRLFTEQELAEMGTPTLDLLLQAIDAGDKDKAKALAQRMKKEYNHLHDGYMFWVAGLQTYIYRNYGIEALEEAERLAHTAEAKVVFKPPEKTDLRSQVEHVASGLRGHMQPITIVETDETISLSMKPCGSGERIIQMGGYSPEVGLAKVEGTARDHVGHEGFPHLLRALPGDGGSRTREHRGLRKGEGGDRSPSITGPANTCSTSTLRTYPRSSTRGSARRSRSDPATMSRWVA